MQRELNSAEVSDLLNRNFELQGKVLQHMRIVDSGQWDQIWLNTPRWTIFSPVEGAIAVLPIPTWGLAIDDDKYGTVVVFPDAKGTLHFSAEVAPQLAGEINKPPFLSPAGNTLEQFFEDLKTAVGRTAALMILGGVVYIIVVNVFNKYLNE
jgi:hypothetical protein